MSRNDDYVFDKFKDFVGKIKAMPEFRDISADALAIAASNMAVASSTENITDAVSSIES